MAQWGIKVSQPNKDVKTCADKDLAFSSQWNTFKEQSIGKVSFELNSSNDFKKIDTINHNLGYIPVVFTWLEMYDGRIITEPWDITYDDDSFWSFFFKVSITSTQLKWEVDAVDEARAGNYTFYYLINIEEL